MRWAVLGDFVVFSGSGTEAPFSLELVREAVIDPEIVSERLRAAGSMSGIVLVQAGPQAGSA